MDSASKYSSFEQYPIYQGNDLELTYTPKKTTFRLWSPDIEAACVRLYLDGSEGSAYSSLPMQSSSAGTWCCTIEEDLVGRFYTFQVLWQGQWLDETPGIYAKAVGLNGKRAAIIDWNQTQPQGWENDQRPPLLQKNDAIIYELHLRDFSTDSHSGIAHKGAYLAFTEKGTRNSFGQATGIDHLKEMGITHVHLMPVFDYATIDESHKDDSYNWGYDPLNYNVPEGSYSTDAANPVCRILEFKQMVMALHQAGIRIIMDVVFNHTYYTEQSNFNLTAPDYFYRQNGDGSYSNASGCGNETASERAMMRKYIVDSVCWWATEYHIDGFRFDLMAIHDTVTMQAVRNALNSIDKTLLLYGEGWTAGDSPLPYEMRAVKQHLHRMPGIAAFSDDLRDALRGTWSNARECGFAAGHTGYDESIKFGVVAATQHNNIHYGLINYSNFPYAAQPDQVINYVSCHDDLCLLDKLQYAAPNNSSLPEMERFARLAQSIVLTSQGIPFIYGGEEMLRTKHGIHNSYQSPDSINQIDWDRKKEHFALVNYLRNLIALRKHHPAFRLGSTELIQNHLHFLDPCQACVVAYLLDGNAGGDKWSRILVVYNGNRYPVTINIPQENWMVVCNGEEVREQGIFKWSAAHLNVPASSAMILCKV